MILGWRCWYDNDDVYSSKDHDWEDLPDDGLLVRIIYYEDDTRQIQQGMDYYYVASHHSGEQILGAGMPNDKIEDRYPDAVIKRGRWTPDNYYRQVVDIAIGSVWNAD